MSALLRASGCQLLVVDAQQRLAPALFDPAGMTARIKLLCLAAARLQVPVTVSEQYPKGLGATLPDITELLPPGALTLPKLCFNSLGDEAIRERLGGLKLAGRGRLVICGAETHVCVLQSAIAAREAGFDVNLVSDASGSRRERDHAAGLARMAATGVNIVTAEMVVFEWLGSSSGPAFKELSAVLRHIQ
ncbi:MAG: isochorismatase family protein [Bosea sp. (in: a-proteobacteria)]